MLNKEACDKIREVLPENAYALILYPMPEDEMSDEMKSDVEGLEDYIGHVSTSVITSVPKDATKESLGDIADLMERITLLTHGVVYLLNTQMESIAEAGHYAVYQQHLAESGNSYDENSDLNEVEPEGNA